MSTFAERLRTALSNANMKAIDLHLATGISKASISEYLSGSYEPKQRNTYKIAAALGVKPSYLMGDISDKESPTTPPGAFPVPGGHRIPVLGRVVAGTPIKAIQDIIEYIEIDERLAKSGTFFGLQVKGDSMEPTLHEGDTIVIRQQEDIESGEIGIVLVNGDEATVKEVKESEAGLTLIGHNVAVYTPHFYSWQEVENLPVQIIGKVVEMRRRM